MFFLPNPQLDQNVSYAFFQKAFTKEECADIRALFNRDLAEKAKIGTQEKPIVVSEIRDANILFLPFNHDTSWIFDRIAGLAIGCNRERWKFQLSGFTEGLQLTHYEPGCHYDWHMDNGNHRFSTRKLSVVLQLSESDDYDGGNLEFIDCRNDSPQREIGTLLLFPSYVAHRVTPVTRGERMSTVAWISGDPYR